MKYPLHTYTDLSNDVCQTIALDKTNTFNGPVNLLNDLNQFRGTFTGTISSNTLVIDGGTFSNLSIYDATLVDPVLSASGQQTTTILQLLQTIQDLQASLEDLKDRIKSLENR